MVIQNRDPEKTGIKVFRVIESFSRNRKEIGERNSVVNPTSL